MVGMSGAPTFQPECLRRRSANSDHGSIFFKATPDPYPFLRLFQDLPAFSLIILLNDVINYLTEDGDLGKDFQAG